MNRVFPKLYDINVITIASLMLLNKSIIHTIFLFKMLRKDYLAASAHEAVHSAAFVAYQGLLMTALKDDADSEPHLHVFHCRTWRSPYCKCCLPPKGRNSSAIVPSLA